MQTKFVELHRVWLRYGDDNGTLALRSTTLAVERGEFVGLVSLPASERGSRQRDDGSDQVDPGSRRLRSSPSKRPADAPRRDHRRNPHSPQSLPHLTTNVVPAWAAPR